MTGWLEAVLAVCAVALTLILAGVAWRVKRTLADMSALAEQAVRTWEASAGELQRALNRAGSAACELETRLAELGRLTGGLGAAGDEIAGAGRRFGRLGREAAEAADDALREARRRNAPELDKALRCLDAGFTLWNAWNRSRRTTSPDPYADGQAEPKGVARK